MMKYLYPQINWEPIKYVGFDLDGTLYDESNFISQVYKKVASVISKNTGSNADLIFSNMYKNILGLKYWEQINIPILLCPVELPYKTP